MHLNQAAKKALGENAPWQKNVRQKDKKKWIIFLPYIFLPSMHLNQAAKKALAKMHHGKKM